jgi:hypothetical protein
MRRKPSERQSLKLSFKAYDGRRRNEKGNYLFHPAEE